MPSLSRQLWQDALPDALAALHHPFVSNLYGGSLPKASFQFFISQDAAFLGVEEELSMHKSYAAAWGVTLTGNFVPSTACTDYTEFVQEVARTESVPCILAAMTPCNRLYAFLGAQLAGAGRCGDNPYAEWVRTYADPAFQALPERMEALLAELGHVAEYSKMRTLYRRAMRLEMCFFSAVPGVPARPAVGLLVVDFDETLTEADTTPSIIATAIAAAEASAGGELKAKVRQEREAQRDQLVANYARERDELLADVLPDRAKPAAAYDPAWVDAFVERLSEFDARMNQAVVDSGVLAGVPRGALARAGRAAALREGAAGALARAQRARVSLHVLSVSWSGELVRGALQGAIAVAHGRGGDGAEATVVHCNELRYDDAGVATGDITRRVEHGADKAAALDRLLLTRTGRRGGAPGAGLAVYIGDSPSDLAPLLAADLGIVIGANALLRRVAAAGGVRLRPLLAAGAALEGRKAPGELYQAGSWAEVEAALFGPRPEGSRAGVRVPRVLAIAGSDSGGGAGVQADLKTCLARGVYGASAISAVTAQDTRGVHGVHAVPPAFLAMQIDAVLRDIGADAVKTGMLPSTDAVAVVADAVVAHGVRNLVVDPVLVATSGDALADDSVAGALRARLFPLAALVTPNLAEAATLLGGRRIDSVDAMKDAARDLHASGPAAVLVKGGHLPADAPGVAANTAVDVLYDGREMTVLVGPRVDTANTHGTGCTTASAVAAELAKGLSMRKAVEAAKAYVAEALARSAPLKIGRGHQRPMNHGFQIHDWAAAARAPRLDLRCYAVTDPGCNARAGRSSAAAAAAALAGGATLLQAREKDADGGDFLAAARELIALAQAQGVGVIVNDRVDVALAAGAAGAHVGQGDLPAATARTLLGADRLLGVSVKSVAQALRAQADGADYLGAGAVFPTSTKDTDVIGVDTLAEICAAVSIPVVAIGGITAANAPAAIEAGCAGVAVVSAVFAAPDVAAAASEIRGVVDAALDEHSSRRR
ncbi:hypothetical protein WJX81_008532 [Elliptochloris bilobata]|uniref:thiamine phosphate synthase n=1 Tax=Elliptochloris bilobata TaxID=381761 RepID=A0AAW1S9A3_9CHLO